MSSTYVNTHLKDEDTIEAQGPLSGGLMVLHLGSNAQVFIKNREQAERLFDVASEIALSFRERFPAVTVDAVIVEEEYVTRCPACGEPIDYCRGHGEIGDPDGRAILTAHDEGDHSGCHPDGCEEANA